MKCEDACRGTNEATYEVTTTSVWGVTGEPVPMCAGCLARWLPWMVGCNEVWFGDPNEVVETFSLRWLDAGRYRETETQR